MNKPKNYPFVEPEMAKLAKEKGFDGDCLALYHRYKESDPFEIQMKIQNGHKGFINYGKNSHRLYPLDEEIITVPLYQTLIDWFREEHRYHVVVKCWGTKFYGNIVDIQEKNEMDWDLTEFDNYYEALQEVILKAFTLI